MKDFNIYLKDPVLLAYTVHIRSEMTKSNPTKYLDNGRVDI